MKSITNVVVAVAALAVVGAVWAVGNTNVVQSFSSSQDQVTETVLDAEAGCSCCATKAAAAEACSAEKSCCSEGEAKSCCSEGKACSSEATCSEGACSEGACSESKACCSEGKEAASCSGGCPASSAVSTEGECPACPASKSATETLSEEH